jgi:4-amino-4-deoxy-L-arabinose transferase-like glycosyltransferase
MGGKSQGYFLILAGKRKKQGIRLGAKEENAERKKTAIYIFIAAFLFYLAIILYGWDSQFYWDEGIYSLMTEEFEKNPAMVIPTVIGENPELKPPLFTWIYYLFHLFLQYLPLPAEAIMRIPSAFFGAGAGVFVFLIGDKFYGRLAGIFSAGIFLACALVCFDSTLAMMEALALFLVTGSMYFYVRGKTKIGMALLGMLTLVKWMYAGLPIIFIIAYYWGDKDLFKKSLTFLVVPAALVFYLVLAAGFGDFGHAFDSLFWDLFRVSGSTTESRIENVSSSFITLFPLSAIFVIASLFLLKEGRETRALIVAGLLFIPIAYAGQFIVWYMSPAIPAMALLAGMLLSKIANRKEAIVAFVIFLAFSFGVQMYLADQTYWPGNTGIKEVAIFMQGKNVEFVEPGGFWAVWASGNKNYAGTDAERLLLEERNSGFLYYRFWNNTDYYNVKATYMNESYSPGCVEYLVIHENETTGSYNANITIPECMHFLFRNGNYAVYGKTE